MTDKKIDMPRIGEVRYCTKQNAHVLVKDLILGNGVCDAVVYYVRSKTTDQVPTKQLVKNKMAHKALNKLKSRWDAGMPGLHHAYGSRFFRKQKHQSKKYQPQTTWKNIHPNLSKGAHTEEKIVVKYKKAMDKPIASNAELTVKKVCNCNMTVLMRSGCQCGGV